MQTNKGSRDEDGYLSDSALPSPTAAAAARGKTRKAKSRPRDKAKVVCRFFARVGSCEKGKLCPFLHDRQSVALCADWLRGACAKSPGECTLSHSDDPGRAPDCTFFQRGLCSNEACRYRHAAVSRTAPVCPAFAAGRCPEAGTCPKKHVHACEDWARTGKCKLGAKCPLWHAKEAKAGGDAKDRPSRKRRRRASSLEPSSDDTRSPTVVYVL